MNRQLEERIVAMYFDNKDFEKNAKQTIDTLGQLKDSLNIQESAAKGFDVFEKINKAMNMDKINQGVTKMKNSLSSMKNVFKKIFEIGPIDNAVRALENFKNKYFDRVLGFDIADKLVNSLENAFRSLTVAPISAGWDQYQSKMDSVKTIMSSTGEDLETVEKHLSQMTEYANKTIYSLTDMTSNLGKFTNNGVELERATMAMEGIANATADAGQGAQQASMAMYNISQAIGVGKMTTIDWKSLENANIATQKLKNTFLEMAAASGRLKKETQKLADGEEITRYFLEADEDGKKLKERIELNASNFREYLSKGWLDKETMLRTLQIYSGQSIDVDTLESWGIHDKELQRDLMELGQQALESATQVRTFQKMMDALKESVQSGWAQSFEIIFGNMEEGTQLWTRLNDKLDGIFSASSKRRNDLLKSWAEMTEGEEDYWTKDKKGNKIRTGALGGREILIESFFEMIDVIQTFGNTISKAFESVFGKLDAKKLFSLTTGFRDFINRLKEWLGTTKDSNSRLSKFQAGLKGVFEILKAGIKIFKNVFDLVKRLAAPVIDFALDAFAKVGKFFSNFGDMTPVQMFNKVWEGIKKVWSKITSLFTVQPGQAMSPFAKWVSNAWNDFKEIVGQWMDDIGLGDVKDAIVDAWNAVAGWSGWATIGKFFSDIWGWISEKTGVVINWFKSDKTGEDSGFTKFLNDVKNTLSTVWESITGWPGWTAIGKFFSDIWGWITDKTGMAINWFTEDKDGTGTGFTKFLNDVATTISTAWESVTGWPGWTAIGNFFNDVWAWITDKTGMAINWFTEDKDGTGTGFTKFLNDVATTISTAWESITGWPGWEAVGKFFTDVWAWIADKAGAAVTWFTDPKDGSDSGFAKFLKDVKATVEGTWNEIKGWTGWGEIGKFLGDIWSWIMAWVDPSSQKTSSGKKVSLRHVAAKANETKEALKTTDKNVGLFERVIGTLTNFFNTIKETVQNVTGVPELTKFIGALSEFMTGLLELITRVFESLGRVMKGEGTFADWSGVVVAGIIMILEQVFQLINNKHLSKIDSGESFAQKFLEIAGGIFLLASGVAMLTAIDQNKMWYAVGAITVIGAVIGAVVAMVNKLTETHNAGKPTELTGAQKILNNLVNQLGKIGMIATAMALLPKIIETIGDVREKLGGASIGEDIMQALLGLATVIGTVGIVFTLIQKFTGNQGLDIVATAKTAAAVIAGIAIIIAGFTVIAGLFSGLSAAIGAEGTNAVVEAINGGAQIMAAIGGAIGGFFGSMFAGGTDAQKTQRTLDDLELVAEAAKAFDTEKVTGITRMMSLIETLSKQGEKIDPSRLDGFAEAMGKLGSGIFEYVRFLIQEDYMSALADLSDPTSDIYIRLMAFQELGTKLGELFSTWGDRDWSQSWVFDRLKNLADPNHKESAGNLVKYLNSIMSSLTDLNKPDTGIQFDGLTIATRLYEAIQEGLIDPSLPVIDASSIVDDILLAIGLGDEAIALAVHDMVQRGITASTKGQNGSGYTIDQKDLDTMKEVIALTKTDTQLDFSGITEQFMGKDGKGGLLGEINSIIDKIPSMDQIFKDKGWLDFKDADGKDIDITSELRTHLQSFGDALNETETFEITITPVFDYSQLTQESVQAALDNRPIALNIDKDTGMIQIDFTGLYESLRLNEITSRLDNIANATVVSGYNTAYAIDRLAGHIDGIANEVSRLKLYLDGGALVGGIIADIDKALYAREFLAGRTQL